MPPGRGAGSSAPGCMRRTGCRAGTCMDCLGNEEKAGGKVVSLTQGEGNVGKIPPPLPFAELQVASAFSFLRGAASPEELTAVASVLGLSAIGITDLNSVAGVVRMWDAANDVGIHLVAGARLSFRDDTPDLLCYPRDRAAWGRLTRLLTVGKDR